MTPKYICWNVVTGNRKASCHVMKQKKYIKIQTGQDTLKLVGSKVKMNLFLNYFLGLDCSMKSNLLNIEDLQILFLCWEKVWLVKRFVLCKISKANTRWTQSVLNLNVEYFFSLDMCLLLLYLWLLSLLSIYFNFQNSTKWKSIVTFYTNAIIEEM